MKFAASRQVSYIYNNLHKPLVISIHSCATNLIEMYTHLKLFTGPDSNVPLSNGNVIDILVHMVPIACCKSTMTATFKPMFYILLEVMKYLEQLEVI